MQNFLEYINENVKIDNVKGRGAVPNNQEIDYFGYRVNMKPSLFVKLAAPLSEKPSQEMIDYIKGGGAIGAPFLVIQVSDERDLYEVVGHEGRHRVLAAKVAFGDKPIETHLFFTGDVRKKRQITPEIIEKLNKGLYQQDTNKKVITGKLI